MLRSSIKVRHGIEGGVKSRVYALEANAHPHDGAPPQPSLLSQQIASTVTSMDKKSPPRPRQPISTNTEDPAHLLMFDRTGAATPPPSRSLSPHHDPTGYLSPNDPTGYFTTHHDPSGFLSPDDPTGYLSPHHDPTGFLSTHDPSGYLSSHDPTGYLSPHRGTPGSELALSGSRPKSWSPDALEVSTLFETSAPPTSQSLERLTTRFPLQGRLSDTNEHQSTTPSGVKPSSTTKGDIKDLKPRSTSEGSVVKPSSNNISSDIKPSSPPRRRICACFRRNSDTREGGGTQDRYTPTPGGCAKDRTADVSGNKVPGGSSKSRTGEISGNKVLEGCTKDQTDPRGSSKVLGGCQKDQTDLRGSSKDPNRCSKVQSTEMSGRKVDKSTSGGPEINLGADRINTDPGGHKGDPGGSYETDRKIRGSCSCPTHDISSSTSPPCNESIATCSESIATCSESIATCSESIATCSESIATCSESLDSCVKTSRSDTNEHQSTTPSGVKPSSTTKGDIKDLKPRSTSEGSVVKPISTNISSDIKPSSPPRRRICACFRRNSDTREGGGTQDRYTPAPGGCAKDRTDPNSGSKVPVGCAKDRTADVSGSKVPGGCSKHRTGEISGNKVLEGCTKDQTDPRGSSKVPGGCQKDQTDLRGSSKDPNRCSKVQSAEMSGRKVDKSTSGGPEVNLGADRINTDPGGHKGDPGGSYETDRKIAATHCISSVILRKKFYASGSGVSSQSKDRFESLQSSEGTRQGNSTFYVTSRQGGSNGDLSGRAMCDTNSDNTRNSNIGGNSHEGNSRHSCGNFNEGENSHEGNTHIQSSPSNALCITRGCTSSPSIQHIASTVSLPSPPPPSRPLSQSLFNYSNSYPTPFSAHAHKLKHHHHLSRSFPSVIGSSSGTLGSLPPRSNCDNAPAHWSTRATNQNARPVHSCDVSTNHSAGGGASRFRVVSIATSSQSLNEGTRSSRVSPKRSLSVEEKRKHPNAKETGMVKNLKDEFEAKTESGLKHRRHHSSSSMTCTCEGNSHSRGNFNEGNSHEGHSRHSCGNFVETADLIILILY
ncbi:uncharacterized protein LOC103509929 [Diaphorina citri]|uniref:Uncharacterized protein LOC103509929 n=1 Tax=Diaphorina citri TaxID=121845 RepID=A0A3Q0IUG3_DIACI|nr:uncharacterized protein LOC103509929 [Diaphorina citri]